MAADAITHTIASYLTPHERTYQQWDEKSANEVALYLANKYKKWPKTISQRILFASKCNDMEQLATIDVPLQKWQDMSMDIVRESNGSHEVMDFLNAKKIKLNPNLIRNCHTLAWFVANNQLPCKQKLQALALQSYDENLVIAVQEMYGRYHPAMRLDIAWLLAPSARNWRHAWNSSAINTWPLHVVTDEQDQRDMMDILLKRELYEAVDTLIDQGWSYEPDSVPYYCPPALYVKTHSPLPRDAFENAIENGNFKLAAYILQCRQPQDIEQYCFSELVYIGHKWITKQSGMSSAHNCVSLSECERGSAIRKRCLGLMTYEEDLDNIEILELLWQKDPLLISKEQSHDVPIHLFPNTYAWLCKHGFYPLHEHAPIEIMCLPRDIIQRLLFVCQFQSGPYLRECWNEWKHTRMTAYQRENWYASRDIWFQ